MAFKLLIVVEFSLIP